MSTATQRDYDQHREVYKARISAKGLSRLELQSMYEQALLDAHDGNLSESKRAMLEIEHQTIAEMIQEQAEPELTPEQVMSQAKESGREDIAASLAHQMAAQKQEDALAELRSKALDDPSQKNYEAVQAAEEALSALKAQHPLTLQANAKAELKAQAEALRVKAAAMADIGQTADADALQEQASAIAASIEALNSTQTEE